MEKNKILVTGGCGYIGSHTIIEILENTHYQVVSVDNMVNAPADAMQRIENITGKKVKNYLIDLCDYQATEQIFKENPDLMGIIHFAAYKFVGESMLQPLKYYTNNLNSLANVLQLAQLYDVPNFIFSSSCSVYGNANHQPVDEQTPLTKAESPYAHTKQIGESMIDNFLKNNQLQAIALRYFNPVGAHISGKIGENSLQINNLVPIITQNAIGIRPSFTIFGNDYPTPDGTCVRDYIHVSDIAQAHILALNYLINKKNVSKFETFNLGLGKGISVLDLVKTFEEITNVKLNYNIGERRIGDVAEVYANPAFSQKVLGWKPKYDLKAMLQTAWQWQLELDKEQKSQ